MLENTGNMKGGYYVYVLYSQKDKKRYTGMTKDLESRLRMHNNGEVPSTKNRRPLKLVYYEWSRYYEEARRRENYLKSYFGKCYIKRRIEKSLCQEQSKKLKNEERRRRKE